MTGELGVERGARPTGSQRRRHLTKGQRAMAVAKITPKQPGKKRTSTASVGVSAQRISYARAVLEFAPDLADAVMSGAKSLDEAYETAQDWYTHTNTLFVVSRVVARRVALCRFRHRAVLNTHTNKHVCCRALSRGVLAAQGVMSTNSTVGCLQERGVPSQLAPTRVP